MYLVNQELFKTVQLKIKQKKPSNCDRVSRKEVWTSAGHISARISIIPMETPREGDP